MRCVHQYGADHIYMLGQEAGLHRFGLFEAFIWLMAIRQIFAHLDNWMSYIAYPAGFAGGIFVGMIIEEKIALWQSGVRIITRKDTLGFINF